MLLQKDSADVLSGGIGAVAYSIINRATAHAIKLLGLSRNTFYGRMWEYEEAEGIPQKNGKR